jgi:hypothetical protein
LTVFRALNEVTSENMKKHSLACVSGLVLALLLVPQASKAGSILFSTLLGSSADDYWQLDTISGGYNPVAQQFTTGDQDVIIDGLALGNSRPYGNLQVSFYTDGGSGPDSLVSNGLLSAPSPENFFFASGLTLNANTPYFVCFSLASTFNYLDVSWAPNIINPAGFTLGKTYSSTDSGATYSGTGDRATYYIPEFYIVGSTVPEPSSLALLVGGLGGLLASRRRR